MSNNSVRARKAVQQQIATVAGRTHRSAADAAAVVGRVLTEDVLTRAQAPIEIHQITERQHSETDPLLALRHVPKVTPTLAAIVRAAQLSNRLLTQCRLSGSKNATPIARELREQIDVTLAFYRGEVSDQSEVVIDLNPNCIKRET